MESHMRWRQSEPTLRIRFCPTTLGELHECRAGSTCMRLCAMKGVDVPLKQTSIRRQGSVRSLSSISCSIDRACLRIAHRSRTVFNYSHLTLSEHIHFKPGIRDAWADGLPSWRPLIWLYRTEAAFRIPDFRLETPTQHPGTLRKSL